MTLEVVDASRWLHEAQLTGLVSSFRFAVEPEDLVAISASRVFVGGKRGWEVTHPMWTKPEHFDTLEEVLYFVQDTVGMENFKKMLDRKLT